MREPGTAAGLGSGGRSALHLAEPAQELVDQERRLGLLGRIAGRTARRRIGGAVDRQPHVLRRIGQLVPARCQPGQPGAMILRHAHSYAHAGQNALVGTQPGVVARDRARVDGLVRIAEQRRVVAGPAGGKRDGVVPRIERRAVAHHPVGHLVETGIEAGTCRRAGRGLAVVAEKYTASRARASILGVRTTGWPAIPRQSPRHWSAVMRSTLRDIARPSRPSFRLVSSGALQRGDGGYNLEKYS